MKRRRVPIISRSRSLFLVLLGIASQVLDPCTACAGDISSPVAVRNEDVALLPAPAATAERFSSGFQSTYIWQKKPRMSAAYTLPDSNSLQQGAETGYTLSATLYLGARPWKHTEIFVNPEVIQTINISDLHGLGGMSNSENQKGGKQIPTLYMARAFARQTISFGGESVALDAGQNQFPSTVGSRRLVISAGLMPLIDVFDTNPYAHDGRTQFLNWALLAHGAFDFAADTRGYTWGIAAEYYHNAWAFRLGRYLVPKESNGMAIDFNLFAHYGDNLEVEHRHTLSGREGRVRVLGFRNYERMGAFAEAVAGASGNVPSMANVRRNQTKIGFGIAAEQAFHRDGGVFLHGSWNDGRTETYSFAEIERSLAVGATMKGPLWHRPGDSVGVAWVMNGLSSEHRNYLAAGGLGFLIGDGQLTRYKPEQILEAYYAIATFPGLWLSVDYQYVANPAYNADRGPVQFLGVRLHIEI
jgi:high affinity Mn2+ porin